MEPNKALMSATNYLLYCCAWCCLLDNDPNGENHYIEYQWAGGVGGIVFC